MKKTFYSELVKTERVDKKMDKLNISHSERIHLVTIIHSSIQTTVIDLVLSHLEDADKHIFLNHYFKNKNDLIWSFLYSKVDNPKEKILKQIEKLLDKFEKDIDGLLKE